MTTSEERKHLVNQYLKLTIKELRKICLEKGIPVRSNASKYEIVSSVTEDILSPKIWRIIEGTPET